MQIAGCLCGCNLPIASLIETLHSEESEFTEDSLRMCIIDLASRKSFASAPGKLIILTLHLLQLGYDWEAQDFMSLSCTRRKFSTICKSLANCTCWGIGVPQHLHDVHVDIVDFFITCIIAMSIIKVTSCYIPGRIADIADSLDSTEEGMKWRWELRSLQALPKALHAPAKEIKKTLNQVSITPILYIHLVLWLEFGAFFWNPLCKISKLIWSPCKKKSPLKVGIIGGLNWRQASRLEWWDRPFTNPS